MTRCYEAYCEPFFSKQCLDKNCTERNKQYMRKDRHKMVTAGVLFDKSDEDRKRYTKFISSKPPRSKPKEGILVRLPVILLDTYQDMITAKKWKYPNFKSFCIDTLKKRLELQQGTITIDLPKVKKK